MAYAALGGVALCSFLQEAAITGGLPELGGGALAALFFGGALLLVLFGWSLGSPLCLFACLVPSLGALAYLAASGQTLSAGPARVLPFYLAVIGIGVLAARVVPPPLNGAPARMATPRSPGSARPGRSG